MKEKKGIYLVSGGPWGGPLLFPVLTSP